MNRLFSGLLDRKIPVDADCKQTHLNESDQSFRIDKQDIIANELSDITSQAIDDNAKFDTLRFNNNTSGHKRLPNDYNLNDNIRIDNVTKPLRITSSGYLSNFTQNIQDIKAETTFTNNNSNNLTASSTTTIGGTAETINNMSGNLLQPNMETLTSGGGGGSGTNNTHAKAQDWIEMPKIDNFMDIFSLGCSLAVILGGLVPYIPQYLKIRRYSDSEGFSTYGKFKRL